MDSPQKIPQVKPSGWKFETLALYPSMCALAPLRRSLTGAYMPIISWRLYADPAVAP